MQDLFLKMTGKEAGQQVTEGVALAHSAQVMEIQDIDPEVNWVDKPKRGIEVCNVGPVEDMITYKETVRLVMMMMVNKLMVLIERLAI